MSCGFEGQSGPGQHQNLQNIINTRDLGSIRTRISHILSVLACCWSWYWAKLTCLPKRGKLGATAINMIPIKSAGHGIFSVWLCSWTTLCLLSSSRKSKKFPWPFKRQLFWLLHQLRKPRQEPPSATAARANLRSRLFTTNQMKTVPCASNSSAPHSPSIRQAMLRPSDLRAAKGAERCPATASLCHKPQTEMAGGGTKSEMRFLGGFCGLEMLSSEVANHSLQIFSQSKRSSLRRIFAAGFGFHLFVWMTSSFKISHFFTCLEGTRQQKKCVMLKIWKSPNVKKTQALFPLCFLVCGSPWERPFPMEPRSNDLKFRKTATEGSGNPEKNPKANPESKEGEGQKSVTKCVFTLTSFHVLLKQVVFLQHLPCLIFPPSPQATSRGYGTYHIGLSAMGPKQAPSAVCLKLPCVSP